MAAGRFLDCHSSQAIGRRLSRDTNPSPPDINSRRASHFSDYRKLSSQFLTPSSDIECSSDISTPKSSKLCIPVNIILFVILACEFILILKISKKLTTVNRRFCCK